MRSRAAFRIGLVMLVASAACAGDTPPAPKEFELGTHRVQVLVPSGWEPLDQGRQKRFRNGEFFIVLQNLGTRTPPPRTLDELVDWGLAEIGHTQRREVKSRQIVMIEGREGVDIETWNRLDHTNPQRVFFVDADGDLLALHTERMALDDSLAAFDVLRASFHFVSARR